jgi:acetylornithine aminotransferase
MLQNLLNRFRKEPRVKHSETAIMNSYARLPVSFVRGEGVKLWDSEGREYLDALGGIAVTFLGHCHPKVSETISLQANKIVHTSNLFHIQEQAELGEKFCAIAGMEKVFFGNSGAEANEAAIKIARLYARSKKIARPVILTAQQSFHGRTMATISATGNPAVQQGFEPLLGDFIHVAYNDIEAMAAHNDNPNVVAIMIEPIQGESGVIVPSDGYLKALRTLCDQHNWLLIVDEIQTGIGRTGQWFAFQHEGIQPDIVTSAKALGNGIPIGACAATGVAAELIKPGTHGTTFGGNPFASKVASTVIDIIAEENLLESAAVKGASLKKQLQHTLGTLENVVDIRGRGLMLGIELDKSHPDLAMRFLESGLIVNITGGGKTIRLLPSVLISDTQVKAIVTTIHDIVSTL